MGEPLDDGYPTCPEEPESGACRVLIRACDERDATIASQAAEIATLRGEVDEAETEREVVSADILAAIGQEPHDAP